MGSCSKVLRMALREVVNKVLSLLGEFLENYQFGGPWDWSYVDIILYRYCSALEKFWDD